jgi:menaquinone-9 beta-reductase
VSELPPADIFIAGAGPAACAAAIVAQRLGRRTLLAPRPSRAQPRPCAGWASPAAAELCRELGVDPAGLGPAFSGLKLWPGDFSKPVVVADADLAGFVVSATTLTAALRTAAQRAGATVLPPAAVQRIQLGERQVTVETGGQRYVAGVLLVADGAGSPAAAAAQLPTAPADGSNGRAACAVVPGKNAAPGVEVLLAGGRALRVATMVRGPTETRVVLHTRDAEQPAGAQLDALLATAARAGALPAATGAAQACPCLAGAALEFEAHVGKRTLLIGAAGGFVASFSGDGLYPALRAGRLAAEAADRALGAPLLQDSLAEFDARWRAELAEYLRMPNTDLGLLLPMVFNNAQMARRVGRAFLLGQVF